MTDLLPAGSASPRRPPVGGPTTRLAASGPWGRSPPGAADTPDPRDRRSAPAQTNTATISARRPVRPRPPATTQPVGHPDPSAGRPGGHQDGEQPHAQRGRHDHLTVTLRNNGPDAATGVQVTDLLPAGLTFASADPSQGTYNSATGLWTVGTVTTAALRRSHLRPPSSPPRRRTTATITGADQFDPDPANNTASAPEVAAGGPGRHQEVNRPDPNVGDTITFTVTLPTTAPTRHRVQVGTCSRRA